MEDAQACNHSGLACDELGDKQGAIDHYSQAISIDPNLAEAYYNRGLSRRDLGDTQGLAADLQAAAKLFRQQNLNCGDELPPLDYSAIR